MPSLTVHELFNRFSTASSGPRMQTPPMSSAIKVNGRPLAYARAGEVVDVPARPITIHQMDALSVDGASVRFRVACGRGTYVRTLGGGSCACARHSRAPEAVAPPACSGPFVLEQAVQVDELARLATEPTDRGLATGPAARARSAPCRVAATGAVPAWLVGACTGARVRVRGPRGAASIQRRVGATARERHPSTTRDETPVGARYVVRDEIGMLALAECLAGQPERRPSQGAQVLARPSGSVSEAAADVE